MTAITATTGTKQREGFILWFTGLSGSGKSTLATYLAPLLQKQGHKVEILDGDEIRQTLSKGLGFSKEDRDTNIRRIGLVARLLARNGVCAVTAAISPYKDVRDEQRAKTKNFVEVYCQCSIEELTDRDTKGLYRKALAGEIKNFTGVNDPYEPPTSPEVVCDTGKESIEDSAKKILAVLKKRGLVD
jgi:adenylyl-sulfate kinase